MTNQPKATPSVALTDGLTRNILFNGVGLAWSVLLALAATPYIVHGLGVEGYGLFGIVSLVAGYAGLLSSPMATGSVRFMAQAYARGEAAAFRLAAIAGGILSGGLALLGSVIILLSARRLTNLFTVSDAMLPQLIIAFQLAAVGFFCNAIVNALQSIPASIRRYDLVNGVNIGLGTIRIFAILGAIGLGYGLVGAVAAQVLTNVLGIMILYWIAKVQLAKIDGDNTQTGWTITALRAALRPLFTFSITLSAQQVAFTVNQQIDRTAIGLFFGASPLTFYTVPLQISERITQLVYTLTTTLYPLSSEAIGSDRLAELQQLYLASIRLLLWFSTCLATLIVAGARDLLLLWMGPEFADRSYFVLVILAIAAVWRTPSPPAFQVCNGLGRADLGIRFAWGYFLVLLTAVFLLTPRWGINGTAVAILIATVPTVLYADILTQRKLLRQTDWSRSLLPYLKPWSVGCLLVVGLALLPDLGSWWNLSIQGSVIICGFVVGLFLLDRPIPAMLWAKVNRYQPLMGWQQR